MSVIRKDRNENESWSSLGCIGRKRPPAYGLLRRQDELSSLFHLTVPVGLQELARYETSLCRTCWHNGQTVQKQADAPYKPDYPTDGQGVNVLKPVNELLTDAVDYQNYRIMKKSPWYNADETNDLNRMTKKTVVQMTDRTFNGSDSCR